MENSVTNMFILGRLRLKCDATNAETRFRLLAERTSQFKSVVLSVHSPAGSRVVRISGSNPRYTMLRGSVKSTGYPLHSTFSPSLPLPCVAVCHHISIKLCPLHGSLDGPKGRYGLVRKISTSHRDFIPEPFSQYRSR